MRTFAAFAVVVGHVTAWMIYTFPPLVDGRWSIDWSIATFFNSAIRFCLPIFIFVAGAALLDPAKQESAKVFFKKRTKRILVPVLFWSIFYTLFKILFLADIFYGGKVTVKALLTDIVEVRIYYHMWYLYVALGFYFLTPFLRTYVRNTHRNKRIKIAVLMMALGVIAEIFNHIYRQDRHFIFVESLPYLGYYLLGYELTLIDRKKINLNYCIIAMIVSFLIIFFGAFFYVKVWGSWADTGRDSIFYHQLLPPVIIFSIAIFLMGYRVWGPTPPEKGIFMNMINRTMPTTLGIYVLHPFVLEVVRRIIIYYGVDKKPEVDGLIALIGTPVLSWITIVICYKITKLLMKIPYARRII